MTALDVPVNLSACEEVISRGLKSFTDVGAALVTIRDGRLYRASYPTFEAYCANRWGFGRKRADELISAADTTRRVTEISGIAPSTESQAKQLRGLKPETAAEVMSEAYESGKVTSAAIKAARERIAPKPVAKVTETTKTETYVNTETGEITSPPAAVIPWHAAVVAVRRTRSDGSIDWQQIALPGLAGSDLTYLIEATNNRLRSERQNRVMFRRLADILDATGAATVGDALAVLGKSLEEALAA